MGSTINLPSPSQPTKGPDALFKTAGVPNEVTYQWRGIDPPAPLYVQRDDFLSVYVTNSAPGVTIGLKGRLLTAPIQRGGQPDSGPPPLLDDDPRASNTIQEIFQVIAPGAGRVTQNFTFPITEGFLMGLGVGANSGSIRKGQCFVQVYLARGGIGQGGDLVPLMQAYVTNVSTGAWPQATMTNSVDGEGAIRSVQVANPAAGVDWTVPVPTGARWYPLSVQARLVTSAAVGNRVPVLSINDGVNFLWQNAQVPAQPASTNILYTWSQSAPNAAAAIIGAVGLNLVEAARMQQAWNIFTSTNGILAGDQWSQINLWLEEWIEP